MEFIHVIIALVALLAGGLGAMAGHWLYRTFIPVINVRLKAIPNPNPKVLLLSMEVENVSKVMCSTRIARLQVAEFGLPGPGRTHSDRLQLDDEKCEQVMVGTTKVEPREIVNTVTPYEWGTSPLVQCVFQMTYKGRFPKHDDSRTTVQWFVNPQLDVNQTATST